MTCPNFPEIRNDGSTGACNSQPGLGALGPLMSKLLRKQKQEAMKAAT